jgi:hypothetical protein
MMLFCIYMQDSSHNRKTRKPQIPAASRQQAAVVRWAAVGMRYMYMYTVCSVQCTVHCALALALAAVHHCTTTAPPRTAHRAPHRTAVVAGQVQFTICACTAAHSGPSPLRSHSSGSGSSAGSSSQQRAEGRARRPVARGPWNLEVEELPSWPWPWALGMGIIGDTGGGANLAQPTHYGTRRTASMARQARDLVH